VPHVPAPRKLHSPGLTLLALAALAGLLAVGAADLSGSPSREAVLLSQFTAPAFVSGLMLIGALPCAARAWPPPWPLPAWC
jgi:hypothetical protein